MNNYEENEELTRAYNDWNGLKEKDRNFCRHVKKHGFDDAMDTYGDFNHVDPIGFGFLIEDLQGKVFPGKRLDLVLELEVPLVFGETKTARKNSHCFVDVSGHDELDVYLLLKLYNVTDPCIQDAFKKLLRPTVETSEQDIKEAISILKRGLEMLSHE